jgi:hypothetical protein
LIKYPEFCGCQLQTELFVFQDESTALLSHLTNQLKESGNPSKISLQNSLLKKEQAHNRLRLKANDAHSASGLLPREVGLSVHSRSSSLRPMDDVALTVTMMNDKDRVEKAKVRLQRIESNLKNHLLRPVKHLSTIDFARKEMESLETHLR